jgi:membrane-bound lytic murein transglycosylase MltF
LKLGLRGLRRVALALGILAGAVPPAAQGEPVKPLPRPVKYEAEFRQVAGARWKRRWAQARVESGLNPFAVSPAGAQGLTQFMPRTFRRAKTAGWVPPHASPFEPVHAIAAQDGYMNLLEGMFQDQGQAWAAYNCGEGNILRARRLAKELGLQGADAWRLTLPSITGRHAAETLAYVPRIEAALARLEASL